MSFSICEKGYKGLSMLTEATDGSVTLLKIVSDNVAGIETESRTIDLLMKESDLRFGNWKRAKAVMSE